MERSKQDNVPASVPRKRKIKSLILGKNRRSRDARQETPTPPQSPSPKRVKSSTKSPERPSSKSEVEPVEPHTKKQIKVFHHSGPKNYFLQEGPVTLTPFENHHAKGGFGVRCTENGQYVGLIALGEEPLCRKLLVQRYVSLLIARVRDGNPSYGILVGERVRSYCENHEHPIRRIHVG